MALQKWREDWKAGREAEGSDGRLPVRYVEDTKELWLLKNKDGMGLINVSAPSRPVQGLMC